MKEHLQRLIDARANAWNEAKEILDKAEVEKRDLNAEESQAYERINADIDGKDEQVRSMLARVEREHEADEARAKFDKLVRDTPKGDPSKDEPTLEERFVSWIRGEARGNTSTGKAFEISDVSEKRTLSKLSAGAGANTVPTSFRAQLMEHLVDAATVRQTSATVLSTGTGEDLQMPKTTSISTAALIAEAGTITASDPVFAQATLKAYKIGHLIQVSHELINDTAVDLLAYLARESGLAIGIKADSYWAVGTGSSQPAGVVTGASAGVTAASATAITTDELIDLEYSVIPPYRNTPGAAWLVKDSTVAYLRKLKYTSGTNAYIWQPSITVGAPDVLFGKPLYADPNMAAIATGNKTVLFGDFSRFFIREVESLRYERSDDYAFNTDLVTFRCLYRTDSILLDQTGAVKYLVQA